MKKLETEILTLPFFLFSEGWRWRRDSNPNLLVKDGLPIGNRDFNLLTSFLFQTKGFAGAGHQTKGENANGDLFAFTRWRK
jgi:hypothetical protein